MHSSFTFKEQPLQNKLSVLSNKKLGLITDGSDYSKVYDSGRSTYTISNIGDNYTNKEYIKNAKGGDNQIDNPRTIHKDLNYKQAMKNSFMIKV